MYETTKVTNYIRKLLQQEKVTYPAPLKDARKAQYKQKIQQVQKVTQKTF